MTDTTLAAAVTRLERAIARLERLPPPDSGDGVLRNLAARHDRLRTRVSETVARLDALIAASEVPR